MALEVEGLNKPRRILLVNRFYGGEQTPTGRMLEDLARRLVEAGHRVQVLTSRQQDYGGINSEPGDAGKVQIKAAYSGPGSSRIVHWIGFWLRAMLTIPLLQWDRCVVLTDPPFMLSVARLCRRLDNKANKLFWWTMDLYPEAMIAKGMIAAEGVAARALRGMVNAGLRETAGVIALGSTQKRLLKRYSNFDDSEAGCLVVPPWDHRSFPPIDRSRNRFLATLDGGQRKVALYAGNLGEAHTFQNLLDTAALLAKRVDDDWLFVFVVRGAQRPALERNAKGMSNIRILDYQPPDMTADLLNAATVHLVTMKPGWEGIIVPSKLYGIASTRAPVLFIGPRDADTAVEINDRGLGACVDCDAGPDEIARRLDQLAAQPRTRKNLTPSDGPQRIAAFLTA